MLFLPDLEQIDEFRIKQQDLLALTMAMYLLDKSLDDSSIGSLIIQRKIKIKTLLYKFSFETTMTVIMYYNLQYFYDIRME